MKNNLLILGAVVVVVVLGVLIFLQLRSAPSTPPMADGGGTTFPTPVGEPATGKATLAGQSGTLIEVTNFLKEGVTVKDPQNVGYHNLGYHNFATITDPPATDNPPYTITFISTTQFFNVSIFKEPIGVIRKEAEEYLRSRLGISEEKMCDLKYTVSTPNWVNAVYAGDDLKFSFCPGSTPLSE